MRRFIEQLVELLDLKGWLMRNWMLAFVGLLALILFLKDILENQ
ncbi:unnamed protein product [marine sediment metagenome]|uniref:Uncharacterized protein n=1 Tax=marine sediment metagenome TaxID=412755 RepID=X0VPA0_9ZZZZ